MSTRSAPRRAVLRWAWRLFRREWRQQVLVLSLITLAVAAAVAGASILVNGATPDGLGQHGEATGLSQIEYRDADFAARALRAAQRRFGTVEVVGHSSAALPGSTVQLDLRAQNPKGVFSHSTVALVGGRYPTAPGEVALTRDVAELVDARVGGRATLGRVEHTVVGIVENPHKLDDDFGVVPAGTPSTTLTFLFDMNRDAGRVGEGPGDESIGFAVAGRADEKGATESIVMVAVTLAMTLVALIAAAGFVVVAQRRQRQLGLLAASGAELRHLRLAMFANGLFVGVAAAAVGTGLGVLGWVLASPAVEAAANHRIDTFDVPWSLVGRCAALAVVMAAIASWWPTRVITRLPIMVALSGRPTRPAPVHRSVAVGAALAAAGVVLMVKADVTGDPQPGFIMAGLLSLIASVVFLAPAAIHVLGRVARRLPFTSRLALRDLVRYHARAAASLAAITLVLGITVTIVGISKATEFGADEGDLAPNQMLVRAGGDGPFPTGAMEVGAFDAAAQRIASLLPDAASVPLFIAVAPPTPNNTRREPIQPVLQENEHSFRGQGAGYVATPELLAYLGVDPSTIRPDAQLLTSSEEPLVLLGTTSRDDITSPAQTQHISLAKFQESPHHLIPPSVVAAHGWTTERDGHLFETPDPLTKEQIAEVRAVAASTGLAIVTRSSQDDIAAIRSIMTTVGMIVALGIAAMTVGLIRGEAARDMQTLTATGASPRARRAITASTTGALATLGVALGVAAAYAALLAAYHSELSALTPLPLLQLALLVFGLPLVATGAGWLVAGREPSAFARQALD